MKIAKLLALTTWAVFALLAATAFLAGDTAAGVRQQPAQPQPQAVPAALTPQERRGKDLYLRGVSASGREVVAVVGELDVPASTVTCAGCHGLRAEGKTEGGVTAGGLAWAHLTKPNGHTHPTGRRHGPFNEAAFARSVVGGVDPDGNELLVAMPRYRLSAEELADLVAYLKRIETDRDPGLTEDAIKVGTFLPSKGPLAETGAAMRDALTAYFDELNRQGGIYNRRVELKVAETGADGAATAASVERLVAGEQLFALVGGVGAGADRELAAFAARERVPFVGPSTLLPQTGEPINRYVFYLLPGLAEQARALVNFAAQKPELLKERVAVVHFDGALTTPAAAAVEAQARKSGWAAPARVVYERELYDPAALARRLKEEGAGVVFFLGGASEDADFIKEAARLGWTPSVFLVGTIAARDLVDAVPASFKDKVFLSFPTVPSDVTPEGLAEFRALVERYKFAPRHLASQLSAVSAAKIFVEGLKLAGKDLTRERLVTALEGLYDVETGLTPRITFGPNRRVGAAGAYVVTVNPEKKEFQPVSGWIKAN